MLPAATKKLKPLRLKRLQRLLAPFGEFTRRPWACSWVLSLNLWKKMEQLLAAVAWISTGPSDRRAFQLHPCFGYQYGAEMRLPSGERSTAWVIRLLAVVSALSNEVTRLICKNPAKAWKGKAVSSKSSIKYPRPVGLSEKKPFTEVNVRYL